LRTGRETRSTGVDDESIDNASGDIMMRAE